MNWEEWNEAMDRARRERAEPRIWGAAWALVNVAVLVAIGVMFWKFQGLANRMSLPSGTRWLFYVAGAMAMGNAIRRLILQWPTRLHRDQDDT